MKAFRLAIGLLTVVATSWLNVWAEDVPPPTSAAYHYIELPPGGLPEFLAWRAIRIPMVSHHRGGPAPGFPENAIETMHNALRYGPGFLEVDVAMLADGTLILMHDDTLDRTTTGSGKVSRATWGEVQALRLVDEAGRRTAYKVPALADVLKWATGRAILTLDIKRGTDFSKVVAEVRDASAMDYVVAISYSLEQAKSFHAMAPEMAISVTVRNADELEAVLASGLPQDRLLAWTGTRLLPRELYDSIHAQGWRVILGTLGNPATSLDGEIARSGASDRYLELFQYGVDVIATDRFWAVQAAIRNPNIFVFKRQSRFH